mmetsp:Transcript_12474/g.15546  ORF Transcript_12474/g.15546 Transcript_12474/m.15546 type:complete len:391 (-) Transcript_12474:69-1241(-)
MEVLLSPLLNMKQFAKSEQWSDNRGKWRRTGHFLPETLNVLCCNGSTYFCEGTTMKVVTQKRLHARSIGSKKSLSLQTLSHFDTPIFCRDMDRAEDRYIAISSQRFKNNHNNIFIFDTRHNRIVSRLSHSESMQVDSAKWSSHGEVLFSAGDVSRYAYDQETGTSASTCEGIIHKWDTNAQDVVCSYDVEDYVSNGCLCPTSFGLFFVTSNKDTVSLWDTRTGRGIVKEFHLGFRAHSLGFLNKKQSLLTAMGNDGRKNRCVTLDFAQFAPMTEIDEEFVDFNTDSTSEGLVTTFGNSLSVGYNKLGEVALWDNEIRGSPTRLDAHGWGSGINGISMSKKEDTIAISAANTGDNWKGLVGAIATLRSKPDPCYSLKRHPQSCSKLKALIL